MRLAEFQQTRHFRGSLDARSRSDAAGIYVGQSEFRIAPSGPVFPDYDIGTTHSIRRSSATRRPARSGTPRALISSTAPAARRTRCFSPGKANGFLSCRLAGFILLKQWGEQPFDPHDQGDLLRTTTFRCIECHNTWIETCARDRESIQARDAHCRCHMRKVSRTGSRSRRVPSGTSRCT